MKLAEALICRKELEDKLYSLESRVLNNTIVQEGEKPNESPIELIEEIKLTNEQLAKLISKINKTNATTKFDEAYSISDAIAKRDELKNLIRMLKSFANKASSPLDRYSNSEIKRFTVINVSKLQKEIDKISKEYRKLDIKLQELNWKVELI